MQNLSINLIRLELIDNFFDFSSELKAKLLSTALNSENIKNDQKIALLTGLLATNDQEKLNLIYDYFLNKDLASAQELFTQEVVGTLFKSNLNEEKKLDLGKKILSYDGLDEELKANISSFLPAEFISSLSRDQETVELKVEAQQRSDFSAKRVTQKSGSSSPDQISSQDSSSPVEVDSNESSPSNLGLSASTSEFFAIRAGGNDSQSTSPSETFSADSASPDQLVVSAPSSPDGLVISASPSPDERRGAPNSPSSITGATIGV